MLSTFINLVGCDKTFPRWCAGRVQQASARRRFDEEIRSARPAQSWSHLLALSCWLDLPDTSRSVATLIRTGSGSASRIEDRTRVAMAYRLLLAYAFPRLAV